MYKAEVRIVEPQTEVSSPNHISSYEEQQLLMKYGYVSAPIKHQSFDPTRDLSYQEMMELEDRKYQDSLRTQQPKINPYSIDPNAVQYQDQRFSSEDGFHLDVRIVSDMKINY